MFLYSLLFSMAALSTQITTCWMLALTEKEKRYVSVLINYIMNKIQLMLYTFVFVRTIGESNNMNLDVVFYLHLFLQKNNLKETKITLYKNNFWILYFS